MKVFKGLAKFTSALALVVASVFGGSSNVMAADVDKPDYRIQISPVRLELDLRPGQVTEAKFKVQNTGTKEFDYELLTGPFSVTDENYTQDLSSTSSYTYIKDWITFSSDSGSIPADGEVEITAKVDVPKDVPAGGQYGVIFARMKEPKDSVAGGIKAEQQVGILVYSKNVDGNTRLEGGVIENKVPSFMFTPPIRATSIVENTGNVHTNATYTLQVFPLFSDEEVYTNEENPETRIILPETRRLNTISWDGAPQLGIFKVRQTVKFMDKTDITEKIVFICPLWFLFIILAIIFLAIFWIVSRTRGRKE